MRKQIDLDEKTAAAVRAAMERYYASGTYDINGDGKSTAVEKTAAALVFAALSAAAVTAFCYTVYAVITM